MSIRERWKHLSASIAATAMVASVVLVAGMTPASAAGTVSDASGRFLSGSALGLNLDSLANLAPALAENNGGVAVEDVHPLDVGVLNTVNIDLGSGLNLLGSNGILALGAVNPYAQANPDGSSNAASGAVTNQGGIGVGGQDGVPQADASFDLSGLIGPGLAGTLTDLDLNVGALSATASQAAGSNGAQSGDYQIAGLDLALTSPLVAGITSGLKTTLTGLQPAVDALPALIKAIPGVGLVATITGVPNVAALVDSLTVVTSLDGSIVANLQTGVVSIDVAQLLTTAGLDLNNLNPNTELLPYITAGLTSQLLPAITTALQGLITQLTNGINSISVTVPLVGQIPLSTLAPVLNPVIAQLVAPVNTVVAGLGGSVITPLANALTTILSLKANVQETPGDAGSGSFTERALQVGLIPSGPTALVNLASATVGPNAGPAAVVVPTASGLSPDRGPAAGGTVVTITGTDFTADATVSVDGSAPITPDSISVDGTTLTFTTPPHAVGLVDVTVATPGGTSNPLGYTYDAIPAPSITALAPTNGPETGGTVVTVTGTGFTGATGVTFDGTAGTAFTVVSDTQITVSTPVHAPGVVDVVVQSPNGASAPGQFTFTPVTAIDVIDPGTGPEAGGTTVTITGQCFTGATGVLFGTTPATSFTVVSDTEITAVAPAGVGTVDVTVVGAPACGDATVPGGFDYQPPVIASLSPVNGPETGGTVVTVTGTGFTGATSVTFDGVDGTDFTVVDDTTITVTTPAHAPGPVDVLVVNPNGASAPGQFTYTPNAVIVAPPVITSPVDGSTVTDDPPLIEGTGNAGNTVTVTDENGAPVCTAIVAADGTWNCTGDIPLGDGEHTITATQTDPLGSVSEPSDPVSFVVAGAVVPTIIGMVPVEGPVAGGTLVTITGTGFNSNSIVTIDGIDVDVRSRDCRNTPEL